jgi:hypothetical protein
MNLQPRSDRRAITVMKRMPLLLTLFLLLLPRSSEAQDTPWVTPPHVLKGPDIPRFNLRIGLGLSVPTGDFSFSQPMNGGYAEPVGITYQFGAAVRLTRGILLLGEIMAVRFPIEQVSLTADAGVSMKDARWDIDGAGLSLRTDFGEGGALRVFFQGGMASYRGSTGVSTGPLAAAERLKSNLAFNAAMGLCYLAHHLTFDLGVRVHMPTFDFINNIYDKKATWISLDFGILYGVG